MPTRRQLIQKITLNSNASSVTFSNIPQNYTDLKIVASTRTTRNDAGVLALRFNGSSTGYSNRYIQGNGSGVLSSTEQDAILTCGATSTANTFGNLEIYIPNYNLSINKSAKIVSIQESNSAGAYIRQHSFLWSDISAISSIVLQDATSTSIVANSTFYLYGITHVPIIRGGEVSISGGYKIHTFKNTASLQVIEGGQVEYLVIAGGGAGGPGYSGGGGAGGYRSSVKSEMSGGGANAEPPLTLTGNTIYTVTVGAGGPYPTTYLPGNNGSNSSLSTVTSAGGGGGGSDSTGVAGGSGGGGAGGAVNTRAGGAGTTGQGYAGGLGFGQSGQGPGGGGGGAGAVGVDGTTNKAGNGGAGVLSSITGSAIYRAGGGGGGIISATPGYGGVGGGGNGGINTANVTNGQSNTGGGGGAYGNYVAGSGGSGIVIIRYPYDGN